MKFTANELSAIEDGMRIAAEQYEKDAETARKQGEDRIADQFVRQAFKANAIVERIEEEND